MYLAPPRLALGQLGLRGDSIWWKVVLLVVSSPENPRLLKLRSNVFGTESRTLRVVRIWSSRERALTAKIPHIVIPKRLLIFPGFEECFGYLVLGLASGLEAFSREPPCDSVGALAARQTPETSGMAWEFLSYYPILPSRYLRDPPSILVEKCGKNLLGLENKSSSL